MNCFTTLRGNKGSGESSVSSVYIKEFETFSCPLLSNHQVPEGNLNKSDRVNEDSTTAF